MVPFKKRIKHYKEKTPVPLKTPKHVPKGNLKSEQEEKGIYLVCHFLDVSNHVMPAPGPLGAAGLSVTLSARFPHTCLVHVPFVDKHPSTLFFQIKLPSLPHPPKKLFWVTEAFHSQQDAHNGTGNSTQRKRRDLPGSFPRGYVPLV